jgi:hypothetical protein
VAAIILSTRRELHRWLVRFCGGEGVRTYGEGDRGGDYKITEGVESAACGFDSLVPFGNTRSLPYHSKYLPSYYLFFLKTFVVLSAVLLNRCRS